MKSYKEVKAQLNLCYDIAIFLEMQNDATRLQIQKYIKHKIEQLKYEIETSRDSEIITKSK